MPETASNSSPTSIHLRSDRLGVEIAQPGAAYQGTRFDWTAFITQITLDGQHTFCVPESYEPGQGTGGVGLCNEFGIDMPIGYDDAQVGDCFPKLGIGLLVRPDEEPYRFIRPYEIAERFPVHIDTSVHQARFTVEPLDCRGYAARLEKTVSVQGAQLEIAYRLENVGRQPLRTVEYCHNFLGIDGHPIGPDYCLRVPYPIQFEPLPPGMMQRGENILLVEENELTLEAVPEHPFYRRLLGYVQTDQAQWALTHTPSDVGISETDDFVPVRVAVWGTTHVISAEIFISLDLQPGETKTWTRRYEFYAPTE